jgi:hypothetical protein
VGRGRKKRKKVLTLEATAVTAPIARAAGVPTYPAAGVIPICMSRRGQFDRSGEICSKTDLEEGENTHQSSEDTRRARDGGELAGVEAGSGKESQPTIPRNLEGKTNEKARQTY